MKRTNILLLSLATVVMALALTAVQAAASPGYQWLGQSGETATTTQSPAEPVAVVSDGSGFSWGDAFIGAGAALFLVLIAAMTVYELRRHRRLTIAPRA